MDEVVKEHKRLSDLASGDPNKWKADMESWGDERKDLLDKLEQSDGEIKRLLGEADICDGES